MRLAALLLLLLLPSCGEGTEQNGLQQQTSVASSQKPRVADDVKCWHSAEKRWDGAMVIDGATIRQPSDLQRFGGKPVIIQKLNLPNADFSGMKIENICVERAELSGSNWQNARIENSVFDGATLTATKFEGAIVRNTLFIRSALDKVDATSADLSGSAIKGGSFDGMVLDRAKLRGFLLHCGVSNERWYEICDDHGYYVKVSAKNADFTNAKIEANNMDAWDLSGAILNNSKIRMTAIMAFKSANIIGPLTIEDGGQPDDLRVELSKGEWRVLTTNLKSAPTLRVTDKTHPSFDCAKASIWAEQYLCGKDEYNATPSAAYEDSYLARYYDEAHDRGLVFAAEQRNWLKQRDRCQKHNGRERDDCMTSIYRGRVAALKDRLRTATQMKVGEERVYLNLGLPTSQAFRQTTLYHKLLPLLVASAADYAIVRHTSPAVTEIIAISYGGGSHSCDLSGKFQFNPRDGRASARAADYDLEAAVPVAEFFGSSLIIVAPDDAYISVCGARAHWGEEMRMIEMPEHMVRKIFDSPKSEGIWNIGKLLG